MQQAAAGQWDVYDMRIIEAALRVVERYTISGTRMALIAKEAKMSTTNLHYHFKTKHDLMMALLQYIQQWFSEMREVDLGGRERNRESQLAGFFEQKKDVLLHHQDLDRVQFDFWSSSHVSPEIYPYFEEAFTIWRQHIMGVILLYEPQHDLEKLKLVAEIMVSMMMGATIQKFGPGDEKHITAYFDSCLKMVNWYLQEG